MIIIRNKQGKAVSKSKNLKQLRARAARRFYGGQVSEVHVGRVYDDHQGHLCVKFANGDYCDCTFGSFEVLCGWVLRWRAVYGAKLFFNRKAAGEVFGDNDILKFGAK